ncbi:hypothetical protein AALC16_03575 [Lachnospiraceae bacterium 29-91]|nr:hypothetical protein C808_04190 [Lachnospiraceae bacterium M18-1]
MKETKNPGCSMLGKLVIYDIKCGRGYTYSACLVPFLLIGFNCLILRNQVISLTAYSGTVWKASSADFLFSFMKGMPVFVIAGAQTRFEVPAVWLIFHWWPSFIISAYVIRTWKLQGGSVLLRLRSRGLWWLGKCIWSMMNVFIYYVFSILSILIFSFAFGELSFDIQPILHGLSAVTSEKLSPQWLPASGILLPFLISAGLVLGQLVFTICLNQAIGNIVTLVVLITSAYLCDPILPGNYLMLFRSGSLIGADGVTFGQGICAAFFMIAAAVAAGLLYIRRYDVK